MIWLMTGTTTDAIISYNISQSENKVYILWATKAHSSSSFRVKTGTEREMLEYKNMIDAAIRMGEKIVEIY